MDPMKIPEEIRSLIRRVYYRYLYGTESLLADVVGRFVQKTEALSDSYDVPIYSSLWDRKYAAGRWDFLRGIREVPHLSVIVGLNQRLAPHGSILDVGCGEGMLQEQMGRNGYSKYLGIDTSATALEALSIRCDERTKFIVHDAETFPLEEQYDTIVFCESLYYFTQPIETLQRYAKALSFNGVIIFSLYQSSPRARAILRCIKQTLPLVMEVRVSDATTSWVVGVFSRQGLATA